jgi:fatty acid desaturase
MSAETSLETPMTAPDPYQAYRRALLSPHRVRELSELRPARAVLDTLWLWSGIIAAWCLVAWFPTWWAVLIAIPVIATRYYALLIVGHDGIHRRLFRSPRWNDWFADLFVFGPVAAITRVNNQNHLGHHRHLTTADDPDLHQFTCLNKYQWHLLLGYLSGATSFWRAFKNVFLGHSATRPAKTGLQKSPAPYMLRDFVLIAIWQVALIGGLSWFVAWWAYPVLWLMPLYLAFMADNFRSFAEHSHPRADSWANEHRLISYISNPLERLFVAPLNMNYHATHHLWPSIPYYNLPLADREIRNHPAAAGIEWRSSYVGYLLRYWRLLPIHDCIPTTQSSIASS